MYFLGIEHGTRGVRCAFLPETSPFEGFELAPHSFFGRKRPLNRVAKRFPSIIREIENFAPLTEIRLVVMTYSMGDSFTEITDIKRLMDRGIRNLKGAGKVVGLGSAIFDEIGESGLNVLAIPGIHRQTPTLLPAFHLLSSHCAAPDKVGSAYLSFLFLDSIGRHGKNFILCDAGANTVTLLIKDGKIVGGVDAALGAPGLLHGPIDLMGIREIDDGGLSANEVFSNSGLFPGVEYKDIKKHPEFSDRYRTLATAVAMEIKGISAFLPEPEGIVITGSAPFIEPGIFKRAIDRMLGGLEVHYLDHRSAALGCACIARDIHHGKREFLGIRVEES